MTALYVVLIVLALLVLLSLLRFGGEVTYDSGGFAAYVRVLAFRVRLYPSRLTDEEKAEKERKKREKAAKKAEKAPKKPEEEEKKGGALSLVMDLLPDLCKAAGRLFRKIHIDRLDLHLVWAAADPADAALGFGRANAALGMMWALLDQNFKVKKHDLRCDVNFDVPSPVVTLRAALTITLGQILAIAIPLLIRFLQIRARQKNQAEHQLTKEA